MKTLVAVVAVSSLFAAAIASKMDGGKPVCLACGSRDVFVKASFMQDQYGRYDFTTVHCLRCGDESSMQ